MIFPSEREGEDREIYIMSNFIIYAHQALSVFSNHGGRDGSDVGARSNPKFWSGKPK
jgi:hypothetical protein